jgi:Protein of unknown function, DUF488
MLDEYKKHKGSCRGYEREFLALMADPKIEEKLDPTVFSAPTALDRSELEPERCHRRLVLEYLNNRWGNLSILHL